MHALIFVIHGFPTVPAMLKNISPGSNFTLSAAPSVDSVCVVSFSTPSEAETSAIRTQPYSPDSSKYFGSSIGLGDAPLSTGLNHLIATTSQCAGTSPSHSTPESFI